MNENDVNYYAYKNKLELKPVKYVHQIYNILLVILTDGTAEFSIRSLSKLKTKSP